RLQRERLRYQEPVERGARGIEDAKLILTGRCGLRVAKRVVTESQITPHERLAATTDGLQGDVDAVEVLGGVQHDDTDLSIESGHVAFGVWPRSGGHLAQLDARHAAALEHQGEVGAARLERQVLLYSCVASCVLEDQRR